MRRFRAISPLLSRNYFSANSLSSSSTRSSLLHSTGRCLQSSTRNHGLVLKAHQFQTNPSRNLGTLPETPTPVEAFMSTKTAEEMLAAFKHLEGYLDGRELGLVSLRVGRQLHEEGEDPEKVFSFAEKALKALDQDGKPSVLVAMALHLMGCANYSLNRLDDSLEYLNRADRLLGRLEEERFSTAEEIRPGLYAVKLALGNVNRALGREDEALGNLKKAMEIKEMTLENDRKELGVEIDVANMQIALGKYDEAINTLKNMVQMTENDKDGENHARVFVLIGKALFNQGKFSDSMSCLKSACRILEKKESVSPSLVARTYSEIATLYDAMNEYETCISLLERASALVKKVPQEQDAEGTIIARIGWVLLSRGQVPRAIPYLESAAERMKESFASDDVSAGYNYNNLGAAYLELERPQSAAKMFEVAKEILDASLGTRHADSIETCQNLSIAYSAMGSYTLAIEFEQQVSDAWEGHGPSAKDQLREAHFILDELKKKACGTSTNQLPIKALLLPRGYIASRLP
ncbi:hypothetical protein PTKIN_Ptkin03bG0177000 [Pterospermum kingtungense]